MIVRDDKCYAENPAPVLKITSARLEAPYLLGLSFNNGEERVFDGRTLFESGEVFAPLRNAKTFGDYRLDYETLTWLDGAIDIAPEYLYAHSRIAHR